MARDLALVSPVARLPPLTLITSHYCVFESGPVVSRVGLKARCLHPMRQSIGPTASL